MNQTWLGISIFGSDFWDPYWKRNFDSIFDSKNSGGKIFSNSAVEKLTKSEFQFQNLEFQKKIHVGIQYT